MASSGLWSSKIPRTHPCQCRTAHLTGSPATPCCSERLWRVNAQCGPALAPVVCSSGHNTQQSNCKVAGHTSSPHRQQNKQQSNKESNKTNNRVGSSSNSHKSCRPNGTSVAAGRLSRVGIQQLSGAAIMKQLKAATSWKQLEQLVEQHSQQMNQRHSSALITHLAQLTAVQQQQLQELEFSVLQQGQQQLSIQSEQQPQQPGVDFEPLIDLQQVAAAILPSAISSNSCNGVDPGVQLFMRRTVAPLIDAHMQQYDARGVANVVWALARLQPVLQTSAAERYPSRRWLETFCCTIQPLLQQCDTQQLSNSLWALVQLQHQPPGSWLEDWYTAFAQQAGFHSSSSSGSGSSSRHGHSSGVSLQSLSTALWSLAHMHRSNSCCQMPPDGWVSSLLNQAALQLQQQANSSSSDGSNGQALSNLLWSCVQLHQHPPQHLLRAVQDQAHAAAAAADIGNARQLLSDQAVSNLMWSLARLHSTPQTCSVSEQGVDDQDEQRRQSSRQCCTSGRDSSSHSVGTDRDTDKDMNSSSVSTLTSMRSCAAVLLSASTCRLGAISWRHLATISWAAGGLQLQPRKDWLKKLQQRLQQPDTAGLQDQELSLLLWGVSHFMQQQPSSSKHRREFNSAVVGPGGLLERLLVSQQGKLAGFNSLALHSSLLSLGRLGFSPPEALLQVWLKEVARRNFLAAAGGQALVDVSCGLAHLRRNQAACDGNSGSISRSSSSGGSWGVGSSASGRLGVHQCRDTDWLTEFCAASASRLGVCTGNQLSGIGWALAALGFRPSVAWLLTWQTAVAEAASSMSAAEAARALWALKHLSAGASGASKAATAAQLVGAVVAAAVAGRSDVHSLAVAADCIADMHSSSSNGRGRSPPHSDFGPNSAQTAMQQLLRALAPRLHGCDSQQLLMVLSAAAAVKPPLPNRLLVAAVQHSQLLRLRHKLSNRSIAGIMVAVARLQAAADQQQFRQQRRQQISRRQFSRWLRTMLRAFAAHEATATELTMVLWSLAVLDYTPGAAWLNDHYLKQSEQVLPRFTPSQLATVGWALTVLNHRPADSWCTAWARSAGAQAAAAAPSQLSLLLYAAATLGCQIDRTWLLSAAASAGNSIRRWSVRDLSFGLWGLAQLGLRAVADGELLEVLFSHLTSGHISVAMQGLPPHHLLQLLQAAVLLRPPAAAGSKAAAALGPDECWPHGKAPQHPISKTTLRRLRWTAKATTQQADAAAAAAVAAAHYHQQLLALQPAPGSESSRQLAEAAATAQDAMASFSAASAAAAAAEAALVIATTGRSPDAVGVPVEPGWVLAWCRAAVQQMHTWSPGVAAAALSALAALGVHPPLAWQQQLLQQTLQRRKDVTRQDVSTISSALDLFNSPLKQQWLQQLQVTYMPPAANPDNVARPSQKDSEQRLSNIERKRRWQQLWLKQKRTLKSQSPAMVPSSNSRMQPREHHLSVSTRYPQRFTGQSLLQLRQQHRTVRLVGWWRRQRQLNHQQRQQRLQQQQQQQRKGVTATEAAWSDWEASNQHRWSSPGRTLSGSSHIMQNTSGVTSNSAGSRQVVRASVPSAGSALQGRKLDSSASLGGVQLAQKPVLRQVQPAADHGNVSCGTPNSSTPQEPNTSSAGTDTATVDRQAAGVDASGDHPAASAVAAEQHDMSSFQETSCIGCNGSVTSTAANLGVAVVVGADAGVVQAVWESLSASSGTRTSGSSTAAVRDVDEAARSMQFVGVHVPHSQHSGGLQQHLSWACSTN